MKTFNEQLADHRANFLRDKLSEHEVQVAIAKDGARPFRNVYDCSIGRWLVIYLDDAEIADAQRLKAIEDDNPPVKALSSEAIESLLIQAGVSPSDIEAAKS